MGHAYLSSVVALVYIEHTFAIAAASSVGQPPMPPHVSCSILQCGHQTTHSRDGVWSGGNTDEVFNLDSPRQSHGTEQTSSSSSSRAVNSPNADDAETVLVKNIDIKCGEE